MDDCLFCKFGRGEAPVKILSENETAFVITPLDPASPNHVLVIPRQHIVSVATMTDDERWQVLPSLFYLGQRHARLTGLDKTGFRTVFNTGPDAHQTVHHLHMHVLGGALLSKRIG